MLRASFAVSSGRARLTCDREPRPHPQGPPGGRLEGPAAEKHRCKCLLCSFQCVHREHLRSIGPALPHPPAGALRQRGEAVDAVFVAVLGMDALAGPEREAGAQQSNGLVLLAEQMHLDAVPLAIVDRAMAERGQVEIAAEFAVDPHQDVEVEAGGHAGRIVIGIEQHALVLFEVGADDHLRAAAEDGAGAPQEGLRLVRLEIANGRAREEADLGHGGDGVRQFERCVPTCTTFLYFRAAATMASPSITSTLIGF